MRRRVDPDFIARGAEPLEDASKRVDVLAGRVASDEIGTRRDEVANETRTRDAELERVSVFQRVSVSQRGAEVSRAVREGQLVLALVDVGDVSSFAVERRESRREENRGGVESEVIEPARRAQQRAERARRNVPATVQIRASKRRAENLNRRGFAR